MSSKYSIIQFVPDHITGERINIGVVAFDRDDVRIRFLTKWDRVSHFANQDIRFLKRIAKDLSGAASANGVFAGMENRPHLNEDLLSNIIGKSINTIEFTEARTSLKNVDDLVNDTAARFLSVNVVAQRGYRTKATAAAIANRKIRDVLAHRLGNDFAEEFLKPKEELRGKFQPHIFDTVVANGVPYLASNSISFELPEGKDLQNQVQLAAWSIRDVLEENPGFPIGVLALPPRPNEENAKIVNLFAETIDLYRELGAAVLDEDSVDVWADSVIRNIQRP